MKAPTVRPAVSVSAGLNPAFYEPVVAVLSPRWIGRASHHPKYGFVEAVSFKSKQEIEMPHPTDVYVGRRVREARVAKGMSQTDLGDKLGVSFQQVQKYEKGTNRIGASRLLQTSMALSVPVEYFFDGIDGVDADEGPNNAKLSRKAIATATKLHQIPDDAMRREIIRLIDVAAEARLAS
ncbi:helix-turn-helix domain-containing protein [Pacificispira sp.]|uniref:helix-turn-helix domain-containing protein n=1 Tax=Pacificispira sp. TaxID=2888761 RepID=UPI002E9BE755|nr:helix-turn-helix transcriptional regulator [Pseudomonadota bacterium]